jgi:formylglycine-generating enzyme required for sulfatase activity
VTLDGFWMGKYELTKRQWFAVMGTTPWAGQDYVATDLDSPAQYITWDDAQSFLATLNNATGKAYRLPSESEWEYACRKGTYTRFYWGDDLTEALIGDYAWWNGNVFRTEDQYPRVVGQKWANAFGLHDMSGNVSEWCEDTYQYNYTGAPTDGSAWVSTDSSYRVFRGGEWSYFSLDCASATRHYGWPNRFSSGLGIRLVRS